MGAVVVASAEEGVLAEVEDLAEVVVLGQVEDSLAVAVLGRAEDSPAAAVAERVHPSAVRRPSVVRVAAARHGLARVRARGRTSVAEISAREIGRVLVPERDRVPRRCQAIVRELVLGKASAQGKALGPVKELRIVLERVKASPIVLERVKASPIVLAPARGKGSPIDQELHSFRRGCRDLVTVVQARDCRIKEPIAPTRSKVVAAT